MAVFVWAFLREALGWNGQPISCNNLTSAWLKGGFRVSQQLGLTCFAGFAWAMWITRNKMCMQKTFPGKPTDIIYIGLSFIQKSEDSREACSEIQDGGNDGIGAVSRERV
jgi:hypothetical protein